MEIINEIGTIFTIASVAPAAIQFVSAELPNIEAEVEADYEAVATPLKAIIADVKVVIQGGTATVETASVEKTVADLGAVVTAVTAIIPKIESDVTGEYAKLVPVIQPLASALGITLPAVPAAPAPAATPAA